MIIKTKLSIFCSRLIEAGWLAALVGVPLFFNIYTARTFEPDKITLMRSIVIVMLMAWVIMVIEQSRSSTTNEASLSFTNRRKELQKIPLFLPTLALVIVYIISTLFSISPWVSLFGSYQRLQGTYSALSYIMIFALMAGNLRSREQADRLITTIIIASIPVSLYGVVQHYGLDPLPWAGDVTQRVASNMGNAIFVASYLIMIIPLTMSRLIEAMAAIIQEEEASWGHTILAAVYIFTLAIQVIAVIFTQSRGPMLGVLGASFVMGLLIILMLRQNDPDGSPLSLPEIGQGAAFVLPLGVAAAVGGGVGYGVGLGLEKILVNLNYQLELLPLLSAGLGGMIGFLGLYTYMAASRKGWRWLWVSWVTLAVLGIAFVLNLNIRGLGMDTYLDPIREMEYVGRLADILDTSEGTGKVRVLIWDASMQLIAPHKPLGIEGDAEAPPDPFNAIRPLVGYGPESMFNAFAFVYPPELAHVEARGSSADRSHNETMDSLVMTGILGFAAFYFLMVSLFYYALAWLGWAPDPAAKRRLIILLLGSGLIGAAIPYLTQHSLTFAPLGLPFGLMAGMILHLVWQGGSEQKTSADQVKFSGHPLLLIGLLGALIGHFIEVHFVFSIAATYTYFWGYAGLLVALSRTGKAELTTPEEEPEPKSLLPTEKTPSSRRDRIRSVAAPKKKSYTAQTRGESWQTWLTSQGLAMAIILIILTFDFITPQFKFQVTGCAEKDNTCTEVVTLLWIFTITWGAGLGIALADTAVRTWQSKVNWFPAFLLYALPSLSYFWIYYGVQITQLTQKVSIKQVEDVIPAASVLTNGLVIFYGALLVAMSLLALVLTWQPASRLNFWRGITSGWPYPVVLLAAFAAIWFKNIDVVRADTYLKEGERYRGQQQWTQAIALHGRARSLDSDEDFYYLMLALDYQLMAQDYSLQQGERQAAWNEGEHIALQARTINPYNPDNTGNMGRYYFTLGQVSDPARFQDALEFFQKATVLAPSNVIYYNLWAQTHYMLGEYPSATTQLEISTQIDPKYPPTWSLLGDTYAAMGDAAKALPAHIQAVKVGGLGTFTDQVFTQRANFYISTGNVVTLTKALAEAVPNSDKSAPLQALIGQLYNMAGQHEQAITYLERARTLGDTSAKTAKLLGNSYLSLEKLAEARPLYEAVVTQNPKDLEAQRALGYICANTGCLDVAERAFWAVLTAEPNDYNSRKNLALVYEQMGQPEKALEQARLALSNAPESEKATLNQFIATLESITTKPPDGL